MIKETLEQSEKIKGVKSPFQYKEISLAEAKPFEVKENGLDKVSLNGVYEMAEGGEEPPSFLNSVKANVPCTVQAALYDAGIIPDPMTEKNDRYAREAAYKVWWFKKEFNYEGGLIDPVLHFDGVCYHAHFYLNGVYLGEHKGMFGGPDFNVSSLLREHNTLLVKIENAPADLKHYSEYADYDEGWKNGTVVNCVYGWHYACIPTRGIWAGVYLISEPPCRFERPFILTEDYKTGKIGVCLKCLGAGSGDIKIKISPHNISGKEQYFSASFSCAGGEMLHYTLNVSNAKLWWPSGYGEQPLYSVQVCINANNQPQKVYREIIGIRQIEMMPISGLDKSKNYNWQFSINGKKIFIKGTNWCTTDALLRCLPERYDRFLTLAKEQNLQLLRAWGGGMPESDYFYKKCDELGLLVQQEWPTCWDSPKTQPCDELVETVYLNTVRIRNHPSLVRWAGGNELSATEEPSIRKMAKLSTELDGTRPFHKTSPYAGSLHNYDTYWMMEDMDNAINLRAPFIGEFGMASCPNRQSVARYVPKGELGAAISRDAKTAFNYHTPRFNEFLWPEQNNDMDHLLMRSKEFLDIKTLDDFILGTQLAQSVAICHTLEAARAAYPEAAGICYYKLTDVYPACSWSTVDYYGVPKISYYAIKEAYKPVHAMLLIKSITAKDKYPVFFLDDNALLQSKNLKIEVSAYDKNLVRIHGETYDFTAKGQVDYIGDFNLPDKTVSEVRLLQIRLFDKGELLDSTFYLQNYKNDIGCIKRFPAAKVSLTAKNKVALLKNTGNVPAVGVFIECEENDTDFYASDNYLMLLPGETREISVTHDKNLTVRGFNI
ncbi:MAG: hypothetical protein J5852_03925 [Clostridia bacterium]|nr:hypothetical protein [Clostridia bacterium]